MSKENSSNSDGIPSSTKSGSGRAIAVKKIFTQALLAVTFVATGGVVLQTAVPVLASQPCSGPPGVNVRVLPLTFETRAKGMMLVTLLSAKPKPMEDLLGTYQYFKACDYLFLQDMKSHCEARWSSWDPRRAGCKTMAYTYFNIVLGVTIAGRS